MSTARQTRGFLFADLRDYSRYSERYGDDAATRLLARYRALVREAIARFEGAEIRTEGDSFYVVFTAVGSAVTAGLAILESADAMAAEPGEAAIRVGIGIHAGETVDGEQGIVSSAVNIAARVCSAAAPGELLVTETVRGLVRGYLEVAFMPVGSRKLKGIAEPMRLFRVAAQNARTGPRRSSTRLLLVGSIVAAAVAVLTVAAWTSFDTWSPAADTIFARPPTASAGATTAGSASSASPAASSPSASDAPGATEGPFPSEAEVVLLARLNVDVQACVRADEDELPRLMKFHGDGMRPMAVAASVRCPGGSGVNQPDEILFYVPSPASQFEGGMGQGDEQIGGAAEVDAVFLGLAGRLGLAPTGCSGSAEGYGEWRLGPAAGRVLCYINTGGQATLVWSVEVEPEPILARAVSRNDDLGQLYAWWRDDGRLSVDQ
ncbi:MAG: adenylate/guanylate cyclase domain-containing protein [Candidatus Limnocylindria bacterium]